jgi:hypothetical protein
MSGAWRVTVDSWITPDALWHGRTVYVVSGEHVHSLPAALAAIAESPPEVYLAEVARQEGSGVERAPREFNVSVCHHGRARHHHLIPRKPGDEWCCDGPERPTDGAQP